jgi:putative transposase
MSTIAAWQDVFTRDIYRNILLDSIRFCQRNLGLVVVTNCKPVTATYYKHYLVGQSLMRGSF